MAILGYAVVPTPDGELEVPVVSIGEAPGPPILRVQTPLGKGQIGLVQEGDVRASPLFVETQYGKLAIAKDVRNRIEHTGLWRAGGFNLTWASAYLGRTQLNRVTRIEVTVDGRDTWGDLGCDAVHVAFDPLECIHVRLRIEVTPVGGGGSMVSPWQLQSSNCGRHYGELQANDVDVNVSGTMVFDRLPPRQYDVWAAIEGWVTQEGRGAGVDGVQITVVKWVEIAG